MQQSISGYIGFLIIINTAAYTAFLHQFIDQPTAIIAKTIKGKDVSFMEDQASWHGAAPNDEQFAVAMADLEKVGEALCQK